MEDVFMKWLPWNVSGDKVVEIGANWIHGPSEENPVFCLARQYGLLDPEALTSENQTVDIGGHPLWIPNFFSSSGFQAIQYSLNMNSMKQHKSQPQE